MNAPIKGHLVAAAALDMPVQCVVAHIRNAAGEPLDLHLALGYVEVVAHHLCMHVQGCVSRATVRDPTRVWTLLDLQKRDLYNLYENGTNL